MSGGAEYVTRTDTLRSLLVKMGMSLDTPHIGVPPASGISASDRVAPPTGTAPLRPAIVPRASMFMEATRTRSPSTPQGLHDPSSRGSPGRLRYLPCAVLALALTGEAALLSDQGAGQEAPRRPNILFVIADDWSYPHASAYGDRTVSTPAFDRVAREGALFTNAFTMAPSCTPSRAAILTGQAVHRLAEGGNLHGFLPARFEVYPDLLEKAGYHVGFTGKGWGPGRFEPGGRSRNPAGPRFESFDEFLAKWRTGGGSGPPREADRPFCFWFGSTDPHRPYDPGSGARAGLRADTVAVPPFLPDTPEVRGDLLDYYFEVQRFDGQLARLLETLERGGELHDTIVVVTSDNGMPFPRAKANLYDAGSRMPLAVRWPRRIKAATTVGAFVGHQDLAATFLEAAGVSVPADVTGRSLLPLVGGSGGAIAGRDRVFIERERHANVRRGDLGYPARAIRTADHLYIRNYRPDRWPAGDPELHFAVGPFGDIDGGPTKHLLLDRRTDPAVKRFFEWSTAKRPADELYDLRTDPAQLVNVAGDAAHSAARERLRTELEAWQRSTGDPRISADDDRWDRYPYYGAPASAEPELRGGAAAAQPARPNVLFIAIDDLNHWVRHLGRNPQVITPNIDRLAARGVTFSRAYCAAPVCNPSRAALLSGLRPSTTGVYDNETDWRPVIAPEKTLLTHFRANGYDTAGVGKIYHGSFDRQEEWDHYGTERRARCKLLNPTDGVGDIKFSPVDCRDEGISDYSIASYGIEQLQREHDKPFLLTVGFRKPHMPWNVPKKYFDMYPLEKIELPPHREDDLTDLPPAGVKMARGPGSDSPDKPSDHEAIQRSGRWKEAVQAYLATITYVDMNVGRLLDALDRSAYRDNTVVVLWGDHGWHLGEKRHWRKFALWEEATRAPLVWVAPGVTKPGSVCARTVDFMSIYPTLADLAGLPTPRHVEGVSIKKLLADPTAAWERPALTTYGQGNHAVRTERWRYIRYREGGEELYDHANDPYEWVNLAGRPEYAAVKAELKRHLPAVNTPPPAATSAGPARR